MHTFCQIIHSKIGEDPCKLVTINRSTTENVTFNLTHDNYNTSSNNKPVLDMNERLLKIIMNMYLSGHITYSIASKFSYFKKTIDNIFINEIQRQKFIHSFYEIQRTYWTLNRAIYRYKFSLDS